MTRNIAARYQNVPHSRSTSQKQFSWYSFHAHVISDIHFCLGVKWPQCNM